MMHSQKKYIVAFFLPFLSLVLLSVYKQVQISTGTDVTLPIRGYDPRDLLSGHYLTFSVDFELPELCKNQKPEERYVCINPRFESVNPPEDCSLFIRGVCKWGRFDTGVERYYVPEKDALLLERLVTDKQASIVLSVGRDGTPRIKELLLNGKPWKEVELEEEKN